MMFDKNYKECIDELSKLDAEIILTKPNYPRAAEPDELFRSVSKNKSKFIVKDNMKNAIEYVFKKARLTDMVLITGSFFLVSDFLKIFDKE